jgi:MoaA/NifB/PqqE/SkfB family radical SAM enzyme
LNNLITEAKKNSVYFFGILGGEPLMYPNLFSLFEKHSDCYFQVFTNGTYLDNEIAKKIRNLGNVSPLISIEGLKNESDIRRGGKDVYNRSSLGIKHCIDNKILTGVATSVCKTNFNDVVSNHFLKSLIDLGVHYVWYYIYRPVGKNPCIDLALSEYEIKKLREFLVNSRIKYPIGIVDTYWDEDGNALCPGVKGISHHINPYCDIELCPPIQFSCDNVGDGSIISEVFNNSIFLKELREKIGNHTCGCILLNDPEYLGEVLEGLEAKNVSGRTTGYEELKQMKVLPCHHMFGNEIPEKHWVYKFAKKNFFFGFGAYG